MVHCVQEERGEGRLEARAHPQPSLRRAERGLFAVHASKHSAHVTGNMPMADVSRIILSQEQGADNAVSRALPAHFDLDWRYHL